jgi:Cu-Zn family superoxide dismutase
MKRNTFIALFLGICCSSLPIRAQQAHEAVQARAGLKAIAFLNPTKGSSVSGVVTFEGTEQGVHVVAEVKGLTPGKHGFHIHEFGDCSADDASSAGGHFNPSAMPHSMPASEKRHTGDMGNLEANKDGQAHLDYFDMTMSLTGDQTILGRGVIVHEKEDDFKTQPTGASGSRLACGVIGVTKSK